MVIEKLGLSPASNQLDSMLVDLWGTALRPSSQKGYLSKVRKYMRFCAAFKCTPVPCSDLQLCHFVSWLTVRGEVQAKYFSQYLSAVRTLHVELLCDVPTGGRLLPRLLLAARNRQVVCESASLLRLPLLVEHVHEAVLWALGPVSGFAVRCVAGLLLAFLFMLRGASAFALTWGDVVLTPPCKVELRIRNLKTSFQASSLLVRSLELPLAPEVAALGRKVAALGLRAGDRLMPWNLNRTVQHVLQQLRVQYPAKGHSCRSGGATAALSLGVPLERVALHGAWSPGSGSIFRYVAVPVKVSPATFSYFGGLLPTAQRVGMMQLLQKLSVKNSMEQP